MLVPLLICLASKLAAPALSPTQLRCEYQTNPIGIGETRPRLSWIVESSERGAKQSAHRITAASSPERLRAGKADLWDSGMIYQSRTNQIEYGGESLRSRQRVWWQVQVWDAKGNGPVTSKVSRWELGLLNPEDWRAKWISAPATKPYVPDISKARWIWYPEGNPKLDAPSGLRHFRTNFTVDTSAITNAPFGVTADDRFVVRINGREVVAGTDWKRFTVVDIRSFVKPGRNTLEIDATNDTSRAGLVVGGELKQASGATVKILSGPDWEASIDGKSWVPAMDLAALNGEPYGKTQWGGEDTRAPYLRRTVHVNQAVRSARLYATARGLYQLSLDGKPVSASVFAPGWTDYRKRIQYQTYDVTTQLRQGEHSLAMVLGNGWYCGHVGLTGGQNYGDRPFGLAQLEIQYVDGTTERIVTDSQWQAGFGPIQANDLLMGESYDARLEAPQATTPAEVREFPNVPLVAQSAPPVTVVQELTPQKITHPTKDAYVFDLGQNMVGWARLRVAGAAGKTVRLRFAEMLNPDGTVYTTNLRGAKATDYYTLSGKGAETYEPTFTFHGFRYVEVVGYPGVPKRSAIQGVVVSSDNVQTGTFACSNPLVNQLQSNIFWGQRGNYLEVPTDCPQRDERLGWMGDAQIFARTATFNNDVAAFLSKWTQDVEDAQSPEGGFSDVSPRMGDQSDGAPAWGDAGVIVPWTLYRVYGDDRILARRYEAMKRWIAYIDSANPNHEWLNRTNNNFGDWLNVQDDTPREVLATAYFARSTDLLARSARVLGHLDDAAKYEALLTKIKAAFVKAYVEADGRIRGDTQTAYILALNFELLPPELRKTAADRLVDHIVNRRKGHLATGFLGVGALNPTLTAIGRSDVAYQLLTNETYPSWGYSIRQGATTIWERWDGWTQEKGFQDPGMNSFNHYSLGSVGEWMVGTVAGVDMDPNVPGFERVVVRPIPGGGITWARAKYDSIRGTVISDWRVTKNRFELKVTVPANTTATVYVPAPNAGAVTEQTGEGVTFLRMDGGCAVYTVGGGAYRFLSRVTIR